MSSGAAGGTARPAAAGQTTGAGQRREPSREDFPPLGDKGGSSTAAAPAPSSSSKPEASEDSKGDDQLGKYGLGGILHVIRMTDRDLNTLALGYDLNTLGLSLNSTDYLYSTLCCPWADSPARVQPEFRLPQCYSLQPPQLRFTMFQRFNIETLFYIFYSMPRDVLQLAAAHELYNRDWRFHKEKKL
eukprot:Sspe_Gene.82641::Locus_54167_Transcript_1_1_Confidence_1.000_Length_598::g.82641::m.82641/K12605/CNOT2, NOT2; CCR4-NOT transcription complex subunit 2